MVERVVEERRELKLEARPLDDVLVEGEVHDPGPRSEEAPLLRVAELSRRGVIDFSDQVAGALEVLLPSGEADLLMGVGGTPEGVMTACAARAASLTAC